jgi:hypothetical protein
MESCVLNTVIAIELGLIALGVLRIGCHLKKRKKIDESLSPQKSDESNEPPKENNNDDGGASKKTCHSENKTEKPALDKSHKNFWEKAFSCYASYWILGIVIILIGFDIAIHIPIIDIKCSYFGAIIGFVGILATFVVISNYAQVKEVKDEFAGKIGGLEKLIDGEISKRIEDYDHTVTGTFYFLMGKIAFAFGENDKNDCSVAFEHYVSALNEFDKATDKTPLNGVLHDIQDFKTQKIPLHIDTKLQRKCLSLLGNINDGGYTALAAELREYISGIEPAKPISSNNPVKPIDPDNPDNPDNGLNQ